MEQEHFSQEVTDKLQYYVYCLVNPADDKIFYIGKGKGDRVFAHAKCAVKEETEETLKYNTIRDILNKGQQVEYFIIRHGLTEDNAILVESVLIDLLTYDGFNTKSVLTNIQKGHGQTEFGIMSVEEINDKYDTSGQTSFCFNGQVFIRKSELVLAVVKDYVAKHPSITLDELKAAFPIKVKHGYDMIMSFADAKKTKNSAGITGGNFAMKEEQLIRLSIHGKSQASKIAVWKYWPDRFFKPFEDSAKKLGYSLKNQSNK